MRRVKYLMLLAGFFILAPLFSQTNIDSLLKVIRKGKADYKTYLELSAFYLQDSAQLSVFYAKEAVDMSKGPGENAESMVGLGMALIYNEEIRNAITCLGEAEKKFLKLNDTSGLASVMNQFAEAYYNISSYDTSLYYCKQALKYELMLGDPKQISGAYNNIGAVAQFIGKIDEAIESLKKGIEIKRTIGDSLGVANGLNNIGGIYHDQGVFDSAALCYIEALCIVEALNETRLQSTLLNNLGSLFKALEEYDKSLDYFTRALSLKKQIGDKKGIATLNNNIGTVYEIQSKYKEALDNFFRAYHFFTEIEFQAGIASACMNIGNIFYQNGKYIEALEYFDKAYAIDKVTGHMRGEVYDLFNMGKTYYQLKNYTKAESLLLSSYKKAEEHNVWDKQMENLYLLSEIKRKKGDYKGALEYYQMHVEAKEQWFNEEKHKQIKEIETRYETEKKEKEIELLSVKNTLNEKQIIEQKKKIIYAGIGIIILLVASFITSMLYLQKRKAYKVIVHNTVEIVNQEKELEELTGKVKLVKKYEASNLQGEQKRSLLQDMLTLLEEDKFYLNVQFTIEQLAEKLGTNRRYLSQVINEVYDTNFNNFINELRIKEARKLIVDPQYSNLTLHGIANQVGFYSRATFISAFKKFTGVTPSFFQKNN